MNKKLEARITRLEKMLSRKNESSFDDGYYEAASNTVAAWDNLINAYLELAECCDDQEEYKSHLNTVKKLRNFKASEFPHAF